MKHKIMALLMTAMCSTHVYAEESSLQLTAGLGHANYEYEGWESFSYQFADIGLNYGISDYFITVNAMVPITDGEATTAGNALTLQRNQYNVNAGYRITDQIAAFAGVNIANSDIESSTGANTTIDETGIHFGVAGTIFASESGALNAKLAYSVTSMDISANSFDGNGFVFGIGWTGFLADRWSYSLNFDGYNYVYDISGIDSTSRLFSAKASLGYMF